MKKIAFVLFYSLLFMACSKKVYTKFATSKDIKYSATSSDSGTLNIQKVGKSTALNCGVQKDYAPDPLYPEHTPLRTIRLNFHIVNSLNRQNNFGETEGRQFVKALVATANAKLLTNKQMHLPLSNTTAVLPIRYQYVLSPQRGKVKDDGIYFHYNDDLFICNKKNKRKKLVKLRTGVEKRAYTSTSVFSPAQFEAYKISEGEIINVFLLEHPPDSLKSRTYNPTADGVGYPTWCKIVAAHRFYKEPLFQEKMNPIQALADYYAGLLNHEVGHSLGLAHTWNTSDGCDDTPKNAGCWNYGEPGKNPCYTEVSNNVMDYNAFRDAYTPCQLGKIHYNMSKENSKQRQVLEPTWCTLDAEKSIIIKKGQQITWSTSKDLEGHLVVETGAALTLQCTVALPKGAKIIVKPKGLLILDGCRLTNRCGEQWKGIEIWSDSRGKGSISSKGDVQIEEAENAI